MKRALLLVSGFVILMVSLSCFCGTMSDPGLSGGAGGEETSAPTLAVLDTPTAAIIVPGPQPTEQPQPTSVPTPQPAIQEARTLVLEWPPVIRAGDSDIIRLTLEVDELGNITPTAEIEGHAVTGETVYIPDLYDTHNIVAMARLDLAGMQVSPAEITSQALLPGQRVTFYWSIHPEEVGEYRGVVWFFLRFVPLDGGPESERAIAAQDIQIQVVSFLGLKAGPARILGVVGGFISTVFGMPFLEDGVKWTWKRIRQGK